jgi:hypothetical protein
MSLLPEPRGEQAEERAGCRARRVEDDVVDVSAATRRELQQFDRDESARTPASSASSPKICCGSQRRLAA